MYEMFVGPSTLTCSRWAHVCAITLKKTSPESHKGVIYLSKSASICVYFVSYRQI